MPGQRKRREQRRRQAARDAQRFAPELGRWEVLFETQDESAWNAELRRLREPGAGIDLSAVRAEVLCGRLKYPTTYRLSRFVPHAAPPADG